MEERNEERRKGQRGRMEWWRGQMWRREEERHNIRQVKQTNTLYTLSILNQHIRHYILNHHIRHSIF